MIKMAIGSYPGVIDENDLKIFGGSHGGFLTAHLLGDEYLSK